jgi:hypothetical protein
MANIPSRKTFKLPHVLITRRDALMTLASTSIYAVAPAGLADVTKAAGQDDKADFRYESGRYE